jgi:cytochrome P450
VDPALLGAPGGDDQGTALFRAGGLLGDAFTLRMHDGPWFFFSAPAALREILAPPPGVLVPPLDRSLFEGVLGAGSLLFLDGPEHARLRRLALPAFVPERMALHAGTIRRAARLALTEAGSRALSPARIEALALEAIVRCTLGCEAGHPLLDLIPRLFVDFFGGVASGRIGPLVEEIDRALFAVLAERRAKPPAGPPDLISALLAPPPEGQQALTDRELRDTLFATLVAGQQTTGGALAYALRAIGGVPGLWERLAAEATGVRQGVKPGATAGASPEAELRGPLLESVVDEALRLSPGVPFVARLAKAPVRIGGYDLPAGCSVVACTFLLHRRPELWPAPETFVPARFVGLRPGPFDYLPFGAGARRCLGAGLALQTLRQVVGEVALAG